MGESEVKVLGSWESFYATRVRIALELKGVEYEYVEEDLRNKSELLLQSNPVHKKIPVLVHKGKPIVESLIILEYIDETWKGGVELLPEDPYERAMVRFWCHFIDNELGGTMRRMGKCKAGEERDAAKQAVVAKYVLLEEAMATTFSGRPFFGGETIGLLDIALGAAAVWIRIAEMLENVKFIDNENTPLLHAWIERFSNVDCIKKLQPSFDHAMDHIQQRITEAKAKA
ncbi:hypothetical protein SUGI_1027560 [Cryptomeria japonica]|uniref:glutathione S-transferase U7 n=1 Tax=Cryptomeria japonica TaxID=3369 RepID=UPI002414ACCD|nr:glutathione S-transferase U7 [Cryptomeria japonica]GLJ48726.1 hypothetical protein SUGI_1027560 [Cryptomeria japonica]